MALERRRFSALDLRHVAGIIARIGALPGVPTTDWCVRAAAACAFQRSGMRIRVGVFSVNDQRHADPDFSFQLGEAGSVSAHSLSGTDETQFSVQMGRALTNSIGATTESVINRKCNANVLRAFIPIGQSERNGWFAIEYLCTQQDDIEIVTALLDTIVPYLEAKVRFAFGYSEEEKPGIASPAEHRVLEQIVLGLSIKKIAEELDRSPHTVHDHVKSLHRKFHATSRGELIARVLGSGSSLIVGTLDDA